MADGGIVTAPIIMSGIACAMGVSTSISMRHGSSIAKKLSTVIWGQRYYEIMFKNLRGDSNTVVSKISRILRWLCFRKEAFETRRSVVYLELIEKNGFITKLFVPKNKFVIRLMNQKYRVRFLFNSQNLLEGVEFKMIRWGWFSRIRGKSHSAVFEDFLQYVDTVLEGDYNGELITVPINEKNEENNSILLNYMFENTFSVQSKKDFLLRLETFRSFIQTLKGYYFPSVFRRSIGRTFHNPNLKFVSVTRSPISVSSITLSSNIDKNIGSMHDSIHELEEKMYEETKKKD